MMPTVGGYLRHHGILGQKWGKQNGPPYPLSPGEHSASERKAGYKKSIGGGRNESLYDRNRAKQFKKNKKIIEKNISTASGENTNKVHKDLQEQLKKTKEYKEYEEASKGLTKMVEQIYEQNPDIEEVYFPEEIAKKYMRLEKAYNSKMKDLVVSNIGRYAVAALKDMKITDFDDREIKYAEKLLKKMSKDI